MSRSNSAKVWAVSKALGKSLAKSAAVLIASWIGFSIAPEVGCLVSLIGSFLLLLGSYHREWKLTRFSVLLPPVTGILCFLVQMTFFQDSAIAWMLFLPVAVGGWFIGWIRGKTHDVYKKKGRIYAQRTVLYLSVWLVCYCITQIFGLLRIKGLVIFGLLSGAFSTAMLMAVAVVLLQKARAVRAVTVLLLVFLLPLSVAIAVPQDDCSETSDDDCSAGSVSGGGGSGDNLSELAGGMVSAGLIFILGTGLNIFTSVSSALGESLVAEGGEETTPQVDTEQLRREQVADLLRRSQALINQVDDPAWAQQLREFVDRHKGDLIALQRAVAAIRSQTIETDHQRTLGEVEAAREAAAALGSSERIATLIETGAKAGIVATGGMMVAAGASVSAAMAAAATATGSITGSEAGSESYQRGDNLVNAAKNVAAATAIGATEGAVAVGTNLPTTGLGVKIAGSFVKGMTTAADHLRKGEDAQKAALHGAISFVSGAAGHGVNAGLGTGVTGQVAEAGIAGSEGGLHTMTEGGSFGEGFQEGLEKWGAGKIGGGLATRAGQHASDFAPAPQAGRHIGEDTVAESEAGAHPEDGHLESITGRGNGQSDGPPPNLEVVPGRMKRPIDRLNDYFGDPDDEE